jgi:hypothetical protein
LYHELITNLHASLNTVNIEKYLGFKILPYMSTSFHIKTIVLTKKAKIVMRGARNLPHLVKVVHG